MEGLANTPVPNLTIKQYSSPDHQSGIIKFSKNYTNNHMASAYNNYLYKDKDKELSNPNNTH